AGLSLVASTRNERTPLPICPKTSGSFPAPNTMSTITSRKMSSGRKIIGILHFLTGHGPVLRTVYGRRSAEQPGQQRYEDRDDHQQGERRQVAEGQDER